MIYLVFLCYFTYYGNPSHSLLFWSSLVPKERNEKRKIFPGSPGRSGCTLKFANTSTLGHILPKTISQGIYHHFRIWCAWLQERWKDNLIKRSGLGRMCLAVLVGVVDHCRRHFKETVTLSRVWAEYNHRPWLYRPVC